MTERSVRRRAPRPTATLAAGLALFAAVLVLLAWQVRSGRDPALGAGRQPVRVAQAPPRRVLVRKIVRRVIDEKVIEREDAPAAAAAPATPASPTVAVSSAPAVVYASPAPAPAPAPVVTRSS
jgi:hypothetical protein